MHSRGCLWRSKAESPFQGGFSLSANQITFLPAFCMSQLQLLWLTIQNSIYHPVLRHHRAFCHCPRGTGHLWLTKRPVQTTCSLSPDFYQKIQSRQCLISSYNIRANGDGTVSILFSSLRRHNGRNPEGLSVDMHREESKVEPRVGGDSPMLVNPTLLSSSLESNNGFSSRPFLYCIF